MFRATVFAILALMPWAIAAAAETGKPAPTAAKMRRVVADYFAAIPQYQSGDLIDRQQVEEVLQRLEAIGWEVPQPDALLARVPNPGEWLVSEFRATPAGRKFMRQIAAYPEAYDRLDRLSTLPHGKQFIRDMIRGPDGYKLVEALTTSKTGKGTARMLSKVPGGAGFDKPTGRIYTAEALVQAMQEARAAAVKVAAGRT